MAYNYSGSGANATPMGKLHPILAAKHGAPPLPPWTPPQSQSSNGSSFDQGYRNMPVKREAPEQDFDKKKKKRKSRWGTEDKKTFIPGMPTTMPPNLTPEQQEAYVTQLKIEEISRMLRTGELGISDNPDERSPSPEPIYNSEGKRLNTREFRVRKSLEEERHRLVVIAQRLNTEYKPPSDYKPPLIKIQDKVMIPQEENPDVNFIGLLIGPRGNTLKKMEKETQAKIMIRGKGSVKEGKVFVWQGRRDGQPNPGEDEPLHALVTGPTTESVRKAVDQIREILKQGIEAPEGQNDLKRMQLRELAALNGTLRDDEILRCRNCGAATHRHWECPEQRNVTNNVVCTKCGAAGHIATDCIQSEFGEVPQIPVDKAKMDSEYLSLMAELGEGPVPPPKPPVPREPAPRATPPPPAPQQLINPRGETPRGPPPSSAPPPWATSGPKPLMSTPVPPPGNLGPPPPSGAPPWANKPGLLGPGGPPMGGRPPHGPGLAGLRAGVPPPGGPFQHAPPAPPGGHGPPPPGGHGPPPPGGHGLPPPGGHGPPPPGGHGPPPPPTSSAPPPWQTGAVPPWQTSQAPGFAPPPPPGFMPFQPPPPPPSEPWAPPPPLMSAPPPPPPPPPPS